jgi:hypothetical protein
MLLAEFLDPTSRDPVPLVARGIELGEETQGFVAFVEELHVSAEWVRLPILLAGRWAGGRCRVRTRRDGSHAEEMEGGVGGYLVAGTALVVCDCHKVTDGRGRCLTVAVNSEVLLFVLAIGTGHT